MLYSLSWVVEGSHNIIVSVDKQFLFVGKDKLASAILWEKDSVSDLNHRGTDGSVLHGFSWSARNDDTLVEFLFLSGCEDDSSLGLGDGLCLSDNNAVEEWSESFEREHFFLSNKILQARQLEDMKNKTI